MSLISSNFISFARNHFRLDWSGIHGASHWARVRHNGLLLAANCAADRAVVEWFAFLHDLDRHTDGADAGHGRRSAELAQAINAQHMNLSDQQLELLITACQGHSTGKLNADITVMVCWDADRLDLGRIGIKPNPAYLCTDTAKDIDFLEAAYLRSIRGLGEIYDWSDRL